MHEALAAGRALRRRSWWSLTAAVLLFYLTLRFAIASNSASAAAGSSPEVLALAATVGTAVLILVSLVLSVPAVVVHELAHAVAARAVGHRVAWIRAGTGPLLLRLERPVPFELRLFPTGGETHALPLPGQRGWAVRRRVLALAGPAANLVLGLALLRLAGRWTLEGILFGLDVRQLLLLAGTLNIVIGLTNLVPLRLGGRPNDGLIVLAPGTAPSPDLARELPTVVRVERHLQAGEVDSAYAAAGTSSLHRPAPAGLRLLQACGHYEAGRYEQARAALLAPTDWTGVDGRTRAVQHENLLAMVDVLMRRPELLAEADRASGAALRADPRSPAVRHTRGLVLIARGQLPRGLALVREVLAERGLTPSQRAEVAATLALGEARAGDRAEARRLLASARLFDPSCRLLRWAEQELR